MVNYRVSQFELRWSSNNTQGLPNYKREELDVTLDLSTKTSRVKASHWPVIHLGGELDYVFHHFRCKQEGHFLKTRWQPIGTSKNVNLTFEESTPSTL